MSLCIRAIAHLVTLVTVFSLLPLFVRLRSPKSPDEEADMGSHEFSYAVYPHSGMITSSSSILSLYFEM